MPGKTGKSVETKAEAALPFEKALERLETIVQSLEGGELGLDQSLELYAEGISLSRQCLGQLTAAEKKVQELNRTAEGLFQLIDAGLEREEEAAE